MEKNIDITLYFVSCILFSIPYNLNLFSNYCRCYVVANMDFGRILFGFTFSFL
jgi:hypothetical protein